MLLPVLLITASDAATASDAQDYEEKDYNTKNSKHYWQLGRLGPDLETAELQAKVGFRVQGSGQGRV